MREPARGGSGRSPHRSGRPGSPPPASGRQWLTGINAVREALRARRRPLFELWLREGPLKGPLQEMADLASSAGLSVRSVGREDLLSLAEGEGNTQGVALEAGPLPEHTLAELIGTPAILIGDGASAPARRFVVLDGVEDPQNVGAIARVAESAGVSGLILGQRRAPPLTPAVARASAGAIEWLPVARVANLARALAELKQAGFWVLAAAPGGESDLYAMEDRYLTGPLAVVLGAEGAGVRESMLSHADFRVEIPMRGRVDSLNVSTAGAVLLFELLRRAERTPPS